MKIIATKKNNGSVIFDLPNMTEAEAISFAKSSIRKTVKANLNKRPYGWTYEVK